jgi:uncharacterized protein (DUF2062 family)
VLKEVSLDSPHSARAPRHKRLARAIVDLPKNIRVAASDYWRCIVSEPANRPRVALSVFLGVFIGVLPTLGIALPLTALATMLFRVPRAPGMAASFIAIPPTLVFFFYPLGYLVGDRLLVPPPVTIDVVAAFSAMTPGNALDTIGLLWSQAKAHLVAFVLGMTIVATVTALLGYGVTWSLLGRRPRAPDPTS